MLLLFFFLTYITVDATTTTTTSNRTTTAGLHRCWLLLLSLLAFSLVVHLGRHLRVCCNRSLGSASRGCSSHFDGGGRRWLVTRVTVGAFIGGVEAGAMRPAVVC